VLWVAVAEPSAMARSTRAHKDLAKANHRWPGNSNDETARGKNDTTLTVKVLDHDGNELKIPVSIPMTPLKLASRSKAASSAGVRDQAAGALPLLWRSCRRDPQ
jgi:hypothetical protein